MLREEEEPLRPPTREKEGSGARARPHRIEARADRRGGRATGPLPLPRMGGEETLFGERAGAEVRSVCEPRERERERRLLGGCSSFVRAGVDGARWGSERGSRSREICGGEEGRACAAFVERESARRRVRGGGGRHRRWVPRPRGKATRRPGAVTMGKESIAGRRARAPLFVGQRRGP